MRTGVSAEPKMKNSTWLTFPAPRPSARVRLFCFPYAGSGSLVYRGWPKHLPETIEVGVARLPGRESRLSEAPYRRLTQIVEDLAPALSPHLDKPYVFFGHSMGAMIGFELARELRRLKAPGPSHLFVSGRPAPQLRGRTPHNYQLPDPELIEELKRLNGTPPEVFSHPELLELMLPIIRADFEVVQTYAYRPEPPLACPITAFGGVEDAEVSRDELEAWRSQTTGAFRRLMLPGDHFFIHSEQFSILRQIWSELESSARTRA